MNAVALPPRRRLPPASELAHLKAYRDARLRALRADRRRPDITDNRSQPWKETP